MFKGEPGRYDIGVQYFDQNNAKSRFHVLLGDQLLDRWIADAWLPSAAPNAHSTESRATLFRCHQQMPRIPGQITRDPYVVKSRIVWH